MTMYRAVWTDKANRNDYHSMNYSDFEEACDHAIEQAKSPYTQNAWVEEAHWVVVAHVQKRLFSSVM